jgi:hypothetical protein
LTNNKTQWKKGRGKLGLFEPLLGRWQAEVDTDRGPVKCQRSFIRILDGAYVQLRADWEFETGSYRELALFGIRPDGKIGFWSFTSDKKQSQGYLADASDIHPQAIGFEAEMPAGLARMVYWPSQQGGFYWAVESKTRSGWNRFSEHHYHKVQG